MPRLFTKEDVYNIHKLVGIPLLINMIYRMCISIIYLDFELGLTSNYFSLYLIIFHTLLPFTSLIFSVPLTRKNVNHNNKNGTTNTKEGIWIAIGFTVRCNIIWLSLWINYQFFDSWKQTPLKYKLLITFIKSIAIFSLFIFHEYISKYYENLINNKFNKKYVKAGIRTWKSSDIFLKYKNLFAHIFSISVYLGGIGILVANNHGVFLVYLIGLQPWFFMTTLSMKGIISYNTKTIIDNLLFIYCFWYTLNYFFLTDNGYEWKKLFIRLFLFIGLYLTRIYLKFNKYLLWFIVILFYSLWLYYTETETKTETQTILNAFFKTI